MMPDPNLILYACIATGTTVLAEFNSKDADLGSLALKCLAQTPPFHSVFSHTIRGKTYTFLIDDHFTYFAIFDAKLENPDGLGFLKSVKEAFDHVAKDDSSKKRLDSLGSHCFQGEFNPVFHQLLAASSVEMEGLHSPRMGTKFSHERSGSLDSVRGMKKVGKIPLLGDAARNLKKKKRGFFEEMVCGGKGKDGERKVDVCDDDMNSREFSVVMHKNNSTLNNQNGVMASVDPIVYQKHAKKAWKKHVWVVLSLDLIVCTILFVVWLWVCGGFKCIDG